MEGHSHYSEREHEIFIQRFKGKVSTIDKNGFLGVAANSRIPIQKTLRGGYTEFPSPKNSRQLNHSRKQDFK